MNNSAYVSLFLAGWFGSAAFTALIRKEPVWAFAFAGVSGFNLSMAILSIQAN